MKYALVLDAWKKVHALDHMNEIMCGYIRTEDDEVTSVWFAPALATAMVNCKECCRKILEATDESIRLHPSK